MKTDAITQNTDMTLVRNSGIEGLRILTIFLIVIAHTTQTLLSNGRLLQIVDISGGAATAQQMLLAFFLCFGKLGNNIFFACSAWFFLEADRFKKRKWMLLLVEIWTVSVLMLLLTAPFLGRQISPKLIVKSFFPTFFGNNWYMTCYLIFYPLHPLLNRLIRGMSRRALFRTALGLLALYDVLSFLGGNFYGAKLAYWITLYFVLAYVKLYLPGFAGNVRKNLLALLIGAAGFAALMLATNALGLKIPALRGQMMRWNIDNNPFFCLIAIALLNLARAVKGRSRGVNFVAGLTMLIYIVHENIILRTYVRPAVFNQIYLRFGYGRIVGWVLLVAAATFLAAALFAAAYRLLLGKAVRKASDALYDLGRAIYRKAEDALLSR